MNFNILKHITTIKNKFSCTRIKIQYKRKCKKGFLKQHYFIFTFFFLADYYAVSVVLLLHSMTKTLVHILNFQVYSMYPGVPSPYHTSL